MNKFNGCLVEFKALEGWAKTIFKVHLHEAYISWGTKYPSGSKRAGQGGRDSGLLLDIEGSGKVSDK